MSKSILILFLFNASLLLINLQQHVSFAEELRDPSMYSGRDNGSIGFTNENGPLKNVSIHKEVKNVNVNNEENTNISMKEKNKFNSQLAQIVINMPKQKVQRKSRRPTDEEKKLWFKIKALIEEIKRNPGNVNAINLLSIVIDGLNPKYIATYRLWKILNSDMMSPYVPPEPLPNPLGSVEKLEFTADKTIPSQLAELASKLKELVVWDLEAMEKLANTPDRELLPVELAIKKALLCASNQHFCPQIDNIQDETSKKLNVRGISDAIGHDPLKKKYIPNLEKLLEEADNDDAVIDIENPAKTNPTSMISNKTGNLSEDNIEDQNNRVETVGTRKKIHKPHRKLHKSPSMSRRTKSYPSRSASGHARKHSKAEPIAKNVFPETTQIMPPAIAQLTESPKSIATNHVDRDAPLSPDSLMRLNRMRNSERFRSQLQFIKKSS